MSTAPRRPWFQFTRWRTFSLRTLLILITGIAVWLGFYVNSVNKQRRAIEVIGKDGHVVYYHEFPFPYGSTGMVDYQAKPGGPRWLRKIAGDDYFRTVRWVGLTPDESSLAELRNLPEVELLGICAYRLRDGDLMHISRLRNLKRLSIESGYSLSDACLEHVKSIPNLSDLVISDTPITDDSVKYLKDMTQLKSLCLNRTLVSQDAVAELRTALPGTTVMWFQTYDASTRSFRPLYKTNDAVTTRSRLPNGN